MISFKTYLTEARMAPLYHGTTVQNANKIIKDNELTKSVGDLLSDDASISFTRKESFARTWAYNQAGLDWNDAIVFEIDQQKISHNYRLKPFNFYDQRARSIKGDKNLTNEYEERIESRSVKNFDKYITKIIVYVKPGKPVKGNLLLNHPKLYYNGKFVNK